MVWYVMPQLSPYCDRMLLLELRLKNSLIISFLSISDHDFFMFFTDIVVFNFFDMILYIFLSVYVLVVMIIMKMEMMGMLTVDIL